MFFLVANSGIMVLLRAVVMTTTKGSSLAPYRKMAKFSASKAMEAINPSRYWEDPLRRQLMTMGYPI
jgi:hypothetical protein